MNKYDDLNDDDGLNIIARNILNSTRNNYSNLQELTNNGGIVHYLHLLTKMLKLYIHFRITETI